MNKQEETNLALYRKSFKKALLGQRIVDCRSALPSMRLDFTSLPSRPLHELKSTFCLNGRNFLRWQLQQHEQRIVHLSEGLISSYPTSVLVKEFQRWCKEHVSPKLQALKFSDVVTAHRQAAELAQHFDAPICQAHDVQKYADDVATGEVQSIVTFYLPFEESASAQSIDAQLKSLSDSMFRVGYCIASSELIAFDSKQVKLPIKVAYVTFELKFSSLDPELDGWLYHITFLKLVPKILKNGLAPHSKHSFFKYPDRVYLFNGDAGLPFILDYALERAAAHSEGKCAMFRIDAEKLQASPLYKSSKLNLYVDQKFPAASKSDAPLAVFTYSNIPVQLFDSKAVLFTTDGIRVTAKEELSLEELKQKAKELPAL